MKLCEGDIYQMCLNLNERADFVSVKGELGILR